MLQCAAFAGPTGSAFSFLLFHSFSHPPLLSGGKTSFLSAGVDRCPRICPQPAHTAPTGQATCFAGVASLPGSQNRTQALTGPNSFFLPRTSLPSPFRGEGRGITFLGLVGSALFVQNWVTLAQQGRLCSLLVLLPYLVLKTGHRATQGRIHFFSPERVYPPPLGGGAGYLLSWVRRVCPARSKLTHTGPTGLV